MKNMSKITGKMFDERVGLLDVSVALVNEAVKMYLNEVNICY